MTIIPTSDMSTRRIGRLLLIILLLSLLCSACSAAKTQILLYEVGSDLESGSAASTGGSSGGAATDEILEIVKSHAGTDPKTIDMIVAFGGADKAGWKGMKIATLDQIRKDAEDGVLGNGRYLYSDPSADMGSPQSLLKFLSTARSAGPADRSILIISDHGASYDGIGVDEISTNSLQMPDLDSALRDAGLSFDPIMFDACLMSSIEVGKTVRPYTPLMLGSEEIQRGGYNYEKFMETLKGNTGGNSVGLLKAVVDAYIDDDPAFAKAMTMSIIDTSQMPAIQSSLDDLGRKLIPLCDDPQGLYDVISAYNDAVRLGVTGNEAPTSIDLVSLLENIRKKRPELSPEVDRTIALVKKSIVYERHNAFSKPVHGISIASPDAMDPEKYQKYGDGVKIAPGWDAFFQRILAVTSEPGSVTISSDSGSTVYAAAEAADARRLPRGTSVLSQPGFTSKGNGSFQLRDPYHAANVYEEYFLINGSQVLSIGTLPARSVQGGLYPVPSWDGRWYYFPARDTGDVPWWETVRQFFTGEPQKPGPLLVAMVYDDMTEGGYGIHSSWVAIRNKNEETNATLVSYVNTTLGRYPYEIIPYTMTENGKALFGDSTSSFPSGSRVTSYTGGFDLLAPAAEEYTLGSTAAGPGMNLTYALLPDGTYAAGLMAYYDENNPVLADEFRILTIKNGAVIGSVIGPLV